MKIGVIGSGSWGMTLAIHLQKNGHDVTVWFYLQKDYDQALAKRELPNYLPGIKLPETLTFTTDMESCIREKELLLIAIPSHTVGQTLGNIRQLIGDDVILVNVAKGIENDSLRTMSQVIAHALPDHPQRMIGPLMLNTMQLVLSRQVRYIMDMELRAVIRPVV